jgi:ribonuclease-3
MSPEREDGLRRLGDRLGHRFGDLGLLDRALTHASRANEEPAASGRDNEPLEFLGDAVLGLAVSDLLHRRDPDGPEGGKSQAKAQLVSEVSLAGRAAALGLPELLALGRGEEKTGGRRKAALWANAYEAVVAALFLDGGFEVARRFVAGDLGPQFEAGGPARDHKSLLQERLQGEGRPLPEYVVVAEEGPSHRPRFHVEVHVEGEPMAAGEGFSKKEAQQEAARRALVRLGLGD